MYKFITVARNTMSDVSPMPMYIYQNEENNKYYISRMYPYKSVFQGESISNELKFYALEYPQEIADSDVKNGSTKYWKMSWNFTV
jgi:hypothetical protein